MENQNATVTGCNAHAWLRVRQKSVLDSRKTQSWRRSTKEEKMKVELERVKLGGKSYPCLWKARTSLSSKKILDAKVANKTFTRVCFKIQCRFFRENKSR